jgi:hypothetical protein
LTLLEVIVSMAIFLLALVAVWQLSSIGSERAEDVSVQSQTSMLCQSKMAEVIIGVQPLGEASGTFADDPDPNLKWEIKATQRQDAMGAWEVSVKVSTLTGSGRTVESTLGQIVMDPTLRGSTQDRPPPPDPPTPTQDAPTPAATTPAVTTPAATTPAATTPAPTTGGAKTGGAKTGP